MATEKEATKTEDKNDAAAESTAVATAATTAVAVSEEISFDDELLGDAGAGSEGIGLEHLTVPFLSILQPLSPQVQKGNAKYIKGAEAGMIMNTLTGQIYKANVGEVGHAGILVSAVKFEPKDIEWKPRGEKGGGGLVRVWGDDTSYQNSPDYQFSKEKNRWISKDGNEVTAHYDTYVVQHGHFETEVVDEKVVSEELEMSIAQAILSCKGSQIKKAKGWNTERNMRRVTVGGKSINPPSWYGTYRVQTRYESNDQGSWYGWEITAYKDITTLPGGKDLYALCKEMHGQLLAGDLKADEAGRMADSASTSGTGGGLSGADIPF